MAQEGYRQRPLREEGQHWYCKEYHACQYADCYFFDQFELGGFGVVHL